MIFWKMPMSIGFDKSYYLTKDIFFLLLSITLPPKPE